MRGRDVSGSFEEAIGRAKAELGTIAEAAEDLVGRVVRVAGPQVPPDEATLAAFDHGRTDINDRQRAVHALLAGQVGEISAAVERARAALEAQEAPRRSDLWLGSLSKGLMRRRMAGRSGGSSEGACLLQALGRCDRMAGIITAHREVIRDQRERAEAALSQFYRREDEEIAKGAELPPPRHADVDAAQAMDRTAISFSTFVDTLNAAIADHTVLLQKLTFDAEHALEVYNILTDMGLVRDALPGPEAYPHFTRSVERLADGILPGGRLAAARQAADRAFAERFTRPDRG